MNEKFDWSKDFGEFLESKATPPPLAVTQAIWAQVRRDLSPSALQVFGKLVLITSIAGAISLLLCPQFGVSFMRHSGLHLLFAHYFGTYGCSIACGAFYSIVGLTAAAFILRPEEFRVLRSNEWLHLSALSALSLAAFISLGSAVFSQSALLWLLGSLAGALITTEVAGVFVLRRTAA